MSELRNEISTNRASEGHKKPGKAGINHGWAALYKKVRFRQQQQLSFEDMLVPMGKCRNKAI